MTSNTSNRLIFFVLALRIAWAHCKCWISPPLIQIPEISMFGRLNEFWEVLFNLHRHNRNVKMKAEAESRKVCIKLLNVIRCAKPRCASRLRVKVIWFITMTFVKPTWPHPKDIKIFHLCILLVGSLVHVLSFLSRTVLMGFARFSFLIITFYFLVFFVVSFGVSCFILKVLGVCPIVSPVSN